MARFNLELVVLLLCGALPLLVSAREITNYTLDFLAVYTGNFSNANQIRRGERGLARVHYRHVPVSIPALGKAPVIYDEWVVNDKVEQMNIFIVSEQPGPTVHLDIYSFTDTNLYQPDQLDVSSLRGLKKEDLRGSNCTGVFRKQAKALYVGYLPDCSHLVKRTRPIFANTFSCIRSSSIVPASDPIFAPSPYILDRVGDRYPPIGYTDTYDNICGRRNTTCIYPPPGSN